MSYKEYGSACHISYEGYVQYVKFHTKIMGRYVIRRVLVGMSYGEYGSVFIYHTNSMGWLVICLTKSMGRNAIHII